MRTYDRFIFNIFVEYRCCLTNTARAYNKNIPFLNNCFVVYRTIWK